MLTMAVLYSLQQCCSQFVTLMVPGVVEWYICMPMNCYFVRGFEASFERLVFHTVCSFTNGQ